MKSLLGEFGIALIFVHEQCFVHQRSGFWLFLIVRHVSYVATGDRSRTKLPLARAANKMSTLSKNMQISAEPNKNTFKCSSERVLRESKDNSSTSCSNQRSLVEKLHPENSSGDEELEEENEPSGCAGVCSVFDFL